MEYRSPLGYNFKLEKSLSASKEEKNQETPRKDEYMSFDSSRRKVFDYDSRRNSGGKSSPWQRQSASNWKTPNSRGFHQDEPAPIEQYYHPSMLENPWEELEKN